MRLTEKFIKEQIQSLLNEQGVQTVPVKSTIGDELRIMNGSQANKNMSNGEYQRSNIPGYLQGLNPSQRNALVRIRKVGASTVTAPWVEKSERDRLRALIAYLSSRHGRSRLPAGTRPPLSSLRIQGTIWGGNQIVSPQDIQTRSGINNIPGPVLVAMANMAKGNRPASQVNQLQAPAPDQYDTGQPQPGPPNPTPPNPRPPNPRPRVASGDPYEGVYKCEADPNNRINAMFTLSVQVERVDQRVAGFADALQREIYRAGVQQFGGRASSFGGANDAILDKIFGDVNLARLRLKDGGRELLLAALFEHGSKPGAGPGEGPVNFYRSPARAARTRSEGQRSMTRSTQDFTSLAKIYANLKDHNVFQSVGVFTNTPSVDGRTDDEAYRRAAKRIYEYLINPNNFYSRRFARGDRSAPLYLQWYRAHLGSDERDARDARLSGRLATRTAGSGRRTAHIITFSGRIGAPPRSKFNLNVNDRAMAGPYDMADMRFERSGTFEDFEKDSRRGRNTEGTTSRSLLTRTLNAFSVFRENILDELRYRAQQADSYGGFGDSSSRFGLQDLAQRMESGDFDPSNPNALGNTRVRGEKRAVRADFRSHNIWHIPAGFRVVIDGRVMNGKKASKLFTLYDERDKIEYKNPGAKCRMESNGIQAQPQMATGNQQQGGQGVMITSAGSASQMYGRPVRGARLAPRGGYRAFTPYVPNQPNSPYVNPNQGNSP